MNHFLNSFKIIVSIIIETTLIYSTENTEEINITNKITQASYENWISEHPEILCAAQTAETHDYIYAAGQNISTNEDFYNLAYTLIASTWNTEAPKQRLAVLINKNIITPDFISFKEKARRLIAIGNILFPNSSPKIHADGMGKKVYREDTEWVLNMMLNLSASHLADEFNQGHDEIISAVLKKNTIENQPGFMTGGGVMESGSRFIPYMECHVNLRDPCWSYK